MRAAINAKKRRIQMGKRAKATDGITFTPLKGGKVACNWIPERSLEGSVRIIPASKAKKRRSAELRKLYPGTKTKPRPIVGKQRAVSESSKSGAGKTQASASAYPLYYCSRCGGRMLPSVLGGYKCFLCGLRRTVPAR